MSKVTIPVHICPNCGSKRTNKIDINNYFCMDCDFEFDDLGNIYIIQPDGELLEYVPDNCEDEDKILEYNLKSEIHKNNQSNISRKYLEDDFIKLFNSGLSCYKIAQKYGVSSGVVRSYLIKNNVYVAKGKGQFKNVS